MDDKDVPHFEWRVLVVESKTPKRFGGTRYKKVDIWVRVCNGRW